MNPAEAEISAIVNEGGLEKYFFSAIESGHIWPAFQPIVDTQSQQIRGFEILSRWNSSHGPIAPQVFIPLLEQRGLIEDLFDAIVRQACILTASLPDACFMAFNVSPVQLQGGRLPKKIADLTAETRFPLQRFQCEITEGALVTHENYAFAVLQDLVDLGVQIAIDDFGTFHSNISRLEAFPFSKLKIDARFIHDIDSVSSRRRITATIIGLGQNLGIPVVAEGVETSAEEEVLRKFNCDLGQGWLYGKPISAQDATNYFDRVDGDCNSTPIPYLPPFEQLHQLTALYDQAPVGLCFIDQNLVHVRANDQFAAMHGMKGSELVGQSIYHVLDKDLLERVLTTLNKLDDGTTVREPYSFFGHDYLIFATKIIDPGLEFMGFSIVSIDITKHLSTSRALTEVELHCRRASRIHLSVPWATDKEGTLLYIGPTLGDSPTETMQERIDGWIARIHPDDLPGLRNSWRSCLPTGRPYHYQFRLSSSDDVYHWVRSEARAYQTPLGLCWYGVFWDIEPEQETT